MKIAILVSGGVDSSVALHLLAQEKEHKIEAFYLKIWLEDEMAFLGACPWEEDLAYAKAVCTQCAVPLHVVSLQKEYHERVVRYTVDAVKAGLTPNPDMLCNREIKFGVFDTLYGNNFDKIATGHYAWIDAQKDGTVRLKVTSDVVKDQTYFLAMMTQEQLQKALFPIGCMQKKDVRTYAHVHNLAPAERKDSQGICFLGKVSFRDFIKEHLGTRKGVFIEKETGKELGKHDGYYFFTIGQRHGINLGGGPWYVCEKDIKRNIVYLTHGFSGDDQRRDSFCVTTINWINGVPQEKKLYVKLRHGPQKYKCTIKHINKQKIHVKLNEKDQGVTPGQYAVFYNSDYCMGGGVITF